MPPILIKTNGVRVSIPWEDVYGPQPPVEVQIPLATQEKFLSSLTAESDSPSPSDPEPNGAQNYAVRISSTRGPGRPPTEPVNKVVGKFGVACQDYFPNCFPLLRLLMDFQISLTAEGSNSRLHNVKDPAASGHRPQKTSSLSRWAGAPGSRVFSKEQSLHAFGFA